MADGLREDGELGVGALAFDGTQVYLGFPSSGAQRGSEESGIGRAFISCEYDDARRFVKSIGCVTAERFVGFRWHYSRGRASGHI
ncbi:hypothetical protein [Anaeromyxobacter sp. PSR-1]|uniref:hypothetical protein n=1 Tax=Anaeromyxobacter sp. PSR-1 TaxID=1300915 RepID=UPI0007516126|nr:hypothetical protein [Anaeromyxobacter sp. PSR-1]